jgi:hypothetical protein
MVLILFTKSLDSRFAYLAVPLPCHRISGVVMSRPGILRTATGVYKNALPGGKFMAQRAGCLSRHNVFGL